MLRYIAGRVLTAIPTLFIIVTLAFFMMRLAPGGPFDSERALPPAIEANMKAAYGLDQPLYVQYATYLGNLATGDFGPSYKYQDFTVTELIAASWPVSLQLGLTALVVALAIGVALGSLAAWRRNSLVDHGVMTLAMTGIAVPNFVVAPVLSLTFGVTLKWLPAGGWDGGVSHMVLPVIALALPYIAYIARMTRASMIDVLSSPHVRTARAKGLPPLLIWRRHVLRPALMPVVSFLGPATAGIMTGSVVIELIFGLPGIGTHFVQGALNRDYTLVLGVVVLYATLIITLNLLVDLAYGWLDPRVRHQ